MSQAVAELQARRTALWCASGGKEAELLTVQPVSVMLTKGAVMPPHRPPLPPASSWVQASAVAELGGGKGEGRGSESICNHWTVVGL